MKTFSTLVAVLAMALVPASLSQAAEFHMGSSSGTVYGGQADFNEFHTVAGNVACSVVDYDGTFTSSTSSTMTISPTYQGCVAFGFVNAQVNMNGCDYDFSANGTMAIKCPEGKVIEVKVPLIGCVVTIGAQVQSSISYTNDAGHLDIVINVKYLSYTANAPCPGPSGSYTDGQYTGDALLAAKDTSGVAASLSVS